MRPILIFGLFALILTPSAFPQGSLTLPGPPAPTMKRLDEVEPRTNVQASPAPAGVDTTNPNYQFVITQPGFYYLSTNLAVTKTNGVQINAESVTRCDHDPLSGNSAPSSAGTTDPWANISY
jgi:hypothetical protein